MSWTKHRRQVKGQMLLKTRTLQNPAAWHQTSPPLTHTHTQPKYITHTHTHTGTRAKMPLFHPSPTIQPAVIPSPPPQPVSFSHSRITLCFFPDGGGRGGVRSPGAVTVLSSCGIFSFSLSFLGGFFSRSFSLKMYSVVFFFLFCFFEEKYYCSSLPSVCNLLIIPRLSDADHSVVVGGDDWHEHSKHAIKCWLFRSFLPSLSLCLSEWGLLFFLLQRMQLNSQELKCRIQHRSLARDWFSHNNVSHCIKREFFLPTHIYEIFPHCSFCRPQYLFPHYFGLQDSPTQTLFVSSAAGLSSQPKTLNYLVIKKRQLNCLFPNSNLGNCIW